MQKFYAYSVTYLTTLPSNIKCFLIYWNIHSASMAEFSDSFNRSFERLSKLYPEVLKRIIQKWHLIHQILMNYFKFDIFWDQVNKIFFSISIACSTIKWQFSSFWKCYGNFCLLLLLLGQRLFFGLLFFMK